MSEDRVTHGALVDHPVWKERTMPTSCPMKARSHPPTPPPPKNPHPYAPAPGLTWPAACGSWDAGCRGGRGHWVQT